MKKTNSVSKFAVKPRELKLETLENRTLLAADLCLGGCVAAAESAEYAIVERVEVSLDDLIPYAAAVVGEETADAAEVASTWYSLVTKVNPTADEQELLEQINRLRTDPQGELDRIFSYYDDDSLVARNSFVDDAIKLNSYPRQSASDFLEMWHNLEAQAPLAFSPALESAAKSHSSYMVSRNDVSHKCTGEDSLTTRVTKAGFVSGISSSGSMAISENIGGCFSENGEFSIASYMLAAFAVDWGVPTHEHLDAMVNAAYTEVGVSVMETSKSVGPYVVTCDFGSSVDGARTDGAYLLGVVYDDADSDFFYDAGEGLANVSIKIEQLDSAEPQSVVINSWNSGGYQIFLANGSYSVTVSGDGFKTSVTKSVTISDGTNAKLDFRTDEAGATAPVVDLNGEAEGIDLEVVFTEGSEEPASVLASSDLSIVDADSNYLYGAKIYFGERPDGEDETLDISVAGTELTALYDSQMGSISISGVGTVAEYEDVIASLTYHNTKETCDLSSARTVLISVYDGVFWSEEATLSISIEPTNLPNMTVHEMKVYEGDEGSKIATFVVELDEPARLDVTFNFNVKDGGTAIEGYDYSISKGDAITIAAGETTATIECYINGNYDALKPEGLKAVDGGYENPYSYFTLEIVDVENAYLTNEDSSVKGYIYDDDSPVILGTTNEYTLANALGTEEGERRYVFTVTPETSGFYSWSSDSLGLPEGMKISVRENGLDSLPIAESVVVEAGGRVQWFADPSVEYWITVESVSDVALIDARLLEVTDEKVVLVDPLLEDSGESLVALMWQDDSLEMSIGSWTWSFDNSFWNGSTVKTTLPDVVFSAELLPGSENSLLAEDDSYSFSMGNDLSMSIAGYATYVVSGNDENEELTLVGTEGDDYLYYSAGYGYFQKSDGQIININGVNVVSIDGAGGNDYAYVEDSRDNDWLNTSNASLTMNGGGYKMTASNFSKSFVLFNKGGEDVYYAEDSGDDVEMTIASTSSIMKGTFSVQDSDEDSSAARLEGDEVEETDSVEYTRTVMGVEKTVVAPTSTIGSVVLNDGGSTNISLNAAVGSLQAYDTHVECSTSISRVKNLTISGVHPYVGSNFVVDMPDEYLYSVDSDYLTIVDSLTGWELRVPAWKAVSESAAVADSTDDALMACVELDAVASGLVGDSIHDDPDNWSGADSAILLIDAAVALLDEGFFDEAGFETDNNSTHCSEELTAETCVEDVCGPTFVQDDLDLWTSLDVFRGQNSKKN